MNTETPTAEVIEPEVLPPEVETKLVKFASQTGLEKSASQTLFEAFHPIFVKARAALAEARGVAESVKDATCVREIARSRACRLALRKVRLEGDSVREAQKKEALLYGKAVQGFYNILLADLTPAETALQEAEDIAERAEAKRLADLKAAREAELVPLLDEPLLGNLADLSEADYMKKLSNAKLLRQAKLDAAAKAEAERKANEEADRVERERIAAENEKLKAEAVAREAAAKAEREAAEKKLAHERAEAARVAAEIKGKADADAKAAAEQAARERAEVEAKAKAEAARIAEVARAEQQIALDKAKAESDRLAEIAAKERAEIEAKAKRAAEEAAAARAQLAEKAKAEAAEAARVEAERKATAAAAKRAAAAADGVKLQRFAEQLRLLPKPALKDAAIQSDLETRVEKLADWAERVLSGELL